jgi:hypothetical protein
MRFNTFCLSLIAFTLTAGLASAQPTSTKTSTKTGATTSTREEQGTVMLVDGNNIVVKMANGEIRHVTAREGATAMIDGKATTVRDLKVGTKLKATYTTTTTSVMDRTVTVGSGKVWYVAGNNVILTLPNGENRQYKVANDYKFTVNGKPATVFELKKGMMVSAEKIVEEPRSVVESGRVITGEAPPPVQTASAPVAAPAPTPRVTPAPARAPEPVAKPAPEAAPAPAELPKTGSPLPLIGLAGTLLTACALGSRALRRNR